ncbi:hypothetical protein Y032_0163g3456 [Ancylostoma ceylanicum]|uniref:Uncharacterized protein n=1 Tax=Ancylostoma ceylanicum TaxID=53326 RepID=A0A016SWN2_9BILA|nr:hypothetical protein Y032_0163g3456 [Ancylostoma ceylanicum]
MVFAITSQYQHYNTIILILGWRKSFVGFSSSALIFPQLYRTTTLISGMSSTNIRDHHLFYECIAGSLCPEHGKLRSAKVGNCHF